MLCLFSFFNLFPVNLLGLIFNQESSYRPSDKITALSPSYRVRACVKSYRQLLPRRTPVILDCIHARFAHKTFCSLWLLSEAPKSVVASMYCVRWLFSCVCNCIQHNNLGTEIVEGSYFGQC
jgi:hypothetical protein